MKEKKDPAILKAFGSISRSSFSSAITHAFPWPIKGKAGHPIKGGELTAWHETRSDHLTNEPIEPQTHSQVATEVSVSIHSFHQRLGTYPSLTRLLPLQQTLSASNMSSSNKLYAGTFCMNQYKRRVLLAHHPSQMRNIRNLLVGGNSKHQHCLSWV